MSAIGLFGAWVSRLRRELTGLQSRLATKRALAMLRREKASPTDERAKVQQIEEARSPPRDVRRKR